MVKNQIELKFIQDFQDYELSLIIILIKKISKKMNIAIICYIIISIKTNNQL